MPRRRDEVFAFFSDAHNLGPLGAIAHALLVRRSLARIFAHRERRIAALLAPAPATSPAAAP